MKALMITAPTSGSGKTTITLGLIQALKNKGLTVCAYKTGPDYIDRAFLEQVSGLPTGNLDLHLQGDEGLVHSLRQAPAETCIIEGVMGYFDGIANTFVNSCYDISQRFEIPSLLVYTPKGEMFSAIPKILGMANFKRSTLKAVLFNQVSPRYYQLLKEALQEYSELEVIGYVPKLDEVVLESRHLGLVQSLELNDLNRKIEILADMMAQTVDLERLADLMAEPSLPPAQLTFDLPKMDIKVGIAKDQAFSFYYRENLELLEQACQVVYFSPINDPAPPECDLLYFGGGYPEVFATELSQNQSMLQAVKAFGDRGGFIFAECGGLLYLSEAVEDNAMVGLFAGRCHLTKTLQRFGYVDIELEEDCILGEKGARLSGHEFHKSETTIAAPTVFKISKTQGPKQWSCGFRYKNTIAGYPHINFLGNLQMIKHLLKSVVETKNDELRKKSKPN